MSKDQAATATPWDERLVRNPEDGTVRFRVDTSIYPVQALRGAAYLFLDDCFVFLDKDGDDGVTVNLKAREEADDAVLEALAGEFLNEALNQTLRVRLAETHGRVREYTLGRAFALDSGFGDIDSILAELDAEDGDDDDPFGIGLAWEEKQAANPKPEEPDADDGGETGSG